jgi:predicted transcriptional regulator
MAAEEPADAVRMLREGEELIRRGRALVRAAENLGASVESHYSAQGASVDFSALPGRSSEGRAEALYTGRRIRDRLFPRDIFGEFAWDLLLALFLAERSGETLQIATIFSDCGITSSTGMRYVKHVEGLGLVQIDPAQSSGTVTLSSEGSRLIRRFFDLTEGAAPLARKAWAPLRSVNSASLRNP